MRPTWIVLLAAAACTGADPTPAPTPQDTAADVAKPGEVAPGGPDTPDGAGNPADALAGPDAGGATQDGAAADVATQDGAAADGATQDGAGAADGAGLPDTAAPPDAGSTDAGEDPAPGTVVAAQPTEWPILFVTQVPATGFSAVSATFNNHTPRLDDAPRGGGLWIRYPDGTLRDLTAAAGYGQSGQQGAAGIAVREPCVHWDGARAVFSMVVGAPSKQNELLEWRWQLYEITGLGPQDTPVVTKVEHQPEANNVAPAYGSDGRLIFASDRPFNGAAHLAPQLDEYETAPVVTGLWSLDPAKGDLFLLQHSPSGSFTPIVDSTGRIVFTRWDHLQRDQQADSDKFDPDAYHYGMFDWSDESPDAVPLDQLVEVFPEARTPVDPELPPGVAAHTFNQFFPWQIAQDGTGEETLEHIGRHELGGTYTDGSFTDDPALEYMSPELSEHANQTYIGGDGGLFQIREDPAAPGSFVMTHAPEFGTDTAGQLVRLTFPAGGNPDGAVLSAITHPHTASTYEDGDAPPTASGHYRDPLPLSDGALVASWTPHTGPDQNEGAPGGPDPAYAFRLVRMVEGPEGALVAGEPLTGGILASVSWWDPYVQKSWSGELWELQAVEVRPRPVPPLVAAPLPAPEAQILAEEGVDEQALRAWLRERDLGLVVSRNVTSRDDADRQQPYNLKVPGGVETVGGPGQVYAIDRLQVFQADLLRGKGGVATPEAGRRVLARPMHDLPAPNPGGDGGVPGSVAIAADGSVAAFVPARRALSWQTVAPDGAPVVRERNWLTVQPGEIRACPTCHGVNTLDQAGAPEAKNPPEALRELLVHWKTL